MGRSLNRSTAVSVPALREVQWFVRELADTMADELGIRIQGDKLSVPPKPAHAVLAVLKQFSRLPPEAKRQWLRDGWRGMEQHLASDTPIRFGLDVVELDAPENDNSGKAEEPARKPRRRA